MDSTLHRAAVDGNEAGLDQLLKEDPLLIQKIGLESMAAAENPLNAAALLGHVNFAKKLLKLRPELAGMKDENGSCPMHLASARGHLEIVKMVLSIKFKGTGESLCSVRDKDGRTPLHLAAANGRVQVIKELLKAGDNELVGAVSSRGETALHLCLQSNQVEAAKLLVEADMELVNVRDSRGNTVLHLATAKKQIQMLELFINNEKIDVNAKNRFNCTALDVLMQNPSEAGDVEIAEMLAAAGCKRTWGLKPQAPPAIASNKGKSWKKRLIPSRWYQRHEKDKNWFKEKHNTLLIVATLIATVTFAAGLSPPGGVWQNPMDNSSPTASPFRSFTAGTAIMNDEEPYNFKLFMYFDMSGLVSSLFIILFLVSGLPLKNKVTTSILVFTIWVAVTSVAMAFVFGTRLVVVSPKISQKLFWVLVSWMGVMTVLLFWHCIVILFNLGYLMKKMRPVWLWVKEQAGGVRSRGKKIGDQLHGDQRDLEMGQAQV